GLSGSFTAVRCRSYVRVGRWRFLTMLDATVPTADPGVVHFRVAALPIAQPRPRAVAIRGHARVFGAPMKHPIHSFKATVRLAVEHVFHGPPLRGPLYLAVVFILPRPGRLRWKTRPMPRCWHSVKPDADNLVKAVTDALTGLLWIDDSQ